MKPFITQPLRVDGSIIQLRLFLVLYSFCRIIISATIIMCIIDILKIPGKDPELLDKKPFTKLSYAWYLSGLPTWKQHLETIWNHAHGRVEASYLPERNHAKIITEAKIYLGLYVFLFLFGIFSAGSWLLWYWIIPVLFGQPFLRLYLMAEHSDCDLSDNMLENSRTTYSSPVINFLAWNMPYHAEHHYLASVPFHALPKLHAYTGQSVKYRGDGYWRVLSDVSGRIRDE